MRITSGLKFIVIVILISSCNIGNTDSNIHIVYNPSDYLIVKKRNPDARIKIIDTLCQSQSYRALRDIREGKLKFFCDSFDYGFSEKQIVFKKIGIEVEHYFGGDIGMIEGFEYGCYYTIMMLATHSELGQKKIDSLVLASEKRFAVKNPDSLFMRDGEDLRKKYLNE